MMAKRKCLVNIRCYETAIWLWQVSLLMAEPDLRLSNRLRQCLLSEWVDRCPPSCLIPFFRVCVHSTQICPCGSLVLLFFHICKLFLALLYFFFSFIFFGLLSSDRWSWVAGSHQCVCVHQTGMEDNIPHPDPWPAWCVSCTWSGRTGGWTGTER